MNLTTLRSESLLLLASAIWGFAFVAQRIGMDHVGPFTFNGVRFALGAFSLVPLLVYGARRRAGATENPVPSGVARVLPYGILAGVLLFAGASLQQVGIVYTTAGKAAFITGLYVVLVPILGLFWHHHTGRWVWAGALCAAVGLYLLSVTGQFRMARGDALVLVGALFWAFHVLLIGWLSPRADPIRIAFVQFLICSVLSLLTAWRFETTSASGLRNAAVPILYGGILSVGVAYTLQLIGQRRTPPAHAAIILSLEAVFGALGGWWILGETMSPRGLLGCALMLAGVLLSQLNPTTDPLGDPVTADHVYPPERETTPSGE